MKEAWHYVAEHPDETSQRMGGGSHLAMISLEELGADFFRPESLRLDAQPIFTIPLLA
jgi:hypothetical protein